MPRGSVSALLVIVLASGCSTHYQPEPGPHISTTVQGGQLTYVRDGREFPHGFAGGGLVDAVEADPQATEAAETYRDRNVGGFIALMVGTACLVGSFVALATSTDASGNNNGTSSHTGDYIAGGALLCAIGGLLSGSIVMATGQTYQFDAVNIYNDHVDQRLRMPYPLPPGAWQIPPHAPVPPPAAPAPAPSGSSPPMPPPPPPPPGNDGA